MSVAKIDWDEISGTGEAIIKLYEAGRGVDGIVSEVWEHLDMYPAPNEVKKHLKIYKYLKSIGQYHAPADVDLFEGDIDEILAKASVKKQPTVSARADEEEEEPEEDSEEDSDAKVVAKRSVPRRSFSFQEETGLQKSFYKWLNGKVSANALNSYKVGLRKALADAEMDFDEFAGQAKSLLPEYYRGGSKEDIGSQASGAVRACVKKVAEFMEVKKPAAKPKPQPKPAQKTQPKPQSKQPPKSQPKSQPKQPSQPKVKPLPEPQPEPQPKQKVAPTPIAEPKPIKPEKEIVADPSKSFQSMKKAVTVIAKRIGKALLITGNGGIGKTYSVTEVLESYGHRRNIEYCVMKTKCTPISMFKFLYKNQDKICIFDDCDSVLRDVEGRSILKSALDSDSREVFWHADRKDMVDTSECENNEEVQQALSKWSAKHDDREGIPNHFFFHGSVIIISNIFKSDIKKLDEALLTRCQVAEVKLTNEEILDRLKKILPTFKILDAANKDIGDKKLKEKVFTWISSKKFLEDERMKGKTLNFRLFINTYKALYANDDGTDDWKQVAFQG